MNNHRASISVIIPCYRCEYTIKRALISIKQQTVSPQEVIIINDGGSQTSCEKIKNICNSMIQAPFEMQIIKLDNRYGPGYARNIGWQLAHCEYIAFLDADDAWHPMKLQIQYNFMKKNPEVMMTGHQSIVLHTRDSTADLPLCWKVHRVKPFMLLISNRFHTRTVMLKRDVPYRFATQRNYSEDYQLWLEIVMSKLPAWRLELPLAFTFKPQFGASGLSGSLYRMEMGELSCYFQIYRQKLIGFPLLIGFITLSIMKFLRRLIIMKVSRN
jgi:glycosyltransferase involved in cell wall biosynthesis